MEYIMLKEYLNNNLLEHTKENEVHLTTTITNKVFQEWNEKLECFTHICDLYDYVFRFLKDGRIVMEDRVFGDSYCEWKGKTEGMYLEYQSIDAMLVDWLEKIRTHKAIQPYEIEYIENLKQSIQS